MKASPGALVFTTAWEDSEGKTQHETLVTLSFTEEQGKTRWAAEEFEHLRTYVAPPTRRDRWRRTSGIHKVRAPRTLAAVRECRRKGHKTLGIVNVVGSTIAREVDGGIYLHAGPEIGVASTKAFTSQVVALALFTLKLARKKDLSVVRGREIARELIERLLELGEA